MIKRIFLATFFVITILTNVVSAQSKWENLPELVKKSFYSTVKVADGAGEGTGVIVGDGTYILTAAHNLRYLMSRGGDTWDITTTDGKKYKASLKKINPDGDTALLKLVSVKPGELIPAPIAGERPKKGDKAYICTAGDTQYSGFAVCLPERYYIKDIKEGLRFADHEGKIGQTVFCLTISNICHPGTSGGPIFNLSGEIIGVSLGVAGNVSNVSTLRAITWLMEGLPSVSAPVSTPNPEIPNSEGLIVKIYCGRSLDSIEKCRETRIQILESLGGSDKARERGIAVNIVFTPDPALYGTVEVEGPDSPEKEKLEQSLEGVLCDL